MDGYVLPDRNQFLQFLKKLKEVFDACDEHADGFIRVQRFVDLGLRFGQGDEVKTLTKFLDPNAHGKINFKDFCHGVFHPFPHAVSHTEPSYLVSLLRAGCEDMFEAAVGPYFVPEVRPSFTDNASAILGEEQFEDYGEGVDLTPSSPGGEETHNTGFSHRGTSSSAGQTPPKMRPLDNNELLDVFCSQCCKKVNLLNDLEARLRDLKASSPNRKMSSRAFGRQLVQSNAGVFGGSAASSTEDLLADSMEPCDITEKVIFLEKKVTELESDRAANGDLKSKLKQENTHLVHRVHELEEEVKDVEVRAEQSLEEELRRHKEAYGRVQREHSAQIELLSNKVQQLEENNQEMKLNVCRLKSQTEKLDQEKQRMTDQLEDSSLQLKDEMELYREVVDQLWLHRHQFHKEKEAMQEVTEDLRRQLERLQLFRLEVEQPGEGWGRAQARAREVQLEVKRLQQENHKLRDQNDDLNAQILSLSLYEAKNLLASHTKAQCLAAEIQTATRDELVDAVKEQEENNYRLRQYMDKIILAILDHNPSILEIKKE
uniref:RAB11 family interacting protein 4 (class II) a n=1 Tax=Gadus morhua TaxID=8049 RepID=A0A8C5APD8_GADMO